MGEGRLRAAYVHYGAQSGVTERVAAALGSAGVDVSLVSPVGRLEPRDPDTGRLRVTREGARHLVAALRFGRRALAHRWNTAFAFDFHSRRAGERIAALPRRPDVVLQNGALFAPGAPPGVPYVLLLDDTRAAAARAAPRAGWGFPAAADYGRAWREREARVYREAAGLATFSERVASSLADDYGIDPRRIAVVGAGANVFPRAAARRDDGRTVLFVGKDFVRKGGRVLAEAFARVRRVLPRARLLVAGPSRPLALPEGAEQLGPVSWSALPELLARATVFALPTLREPFGLALLDAMACGVPCVATAVDAVPEIVVHRGTGLLVPPADPVALAGALLEVLDCPRRAREMGARGRSRVAERFRWSHVAARLERVLRVAAGKAEKRVERSTGRASSR